MTKCILTSAALVLALAVSTFAQAKQPTKQPSVWIGMQLQLGMPRDAVITELTTQYKVTKVEGEVDDWVVADKDNPQIWQGYLGFHDGKLTFASRSWTQGDEDTYDFAQALWGAMSQMDTDGQHACSFDVPTTRSPTAEIRYVRYYCGPKKIVIMITNILNGEGKGHLTSISEVLSSEKTR